MDDTLILSSYPEHFDCPICLELVYDPVEHILCDRIFCRDCISCAKTCPTCRGKISKTNIKPLNRYLKENYDNIEMKCSNNSRGCTKICSIGTVNSHLKSCLFELVRCRYRGCSAEETRKDINDHEQICARRPVSCKYCNENLQLCFLSDHYPECQRFPVKCKLCEETYPRFEETQHKAQCPKRICECARCEMRFYREELQQHFQTVCPKRSVTCTYCSETLVCDEKRKHEERCKITMVKCQFCRERFERRNCHEHLRSCPEALFECNKCGKEVKREEIEHHKTEGCPAIYIFCRYCNKIEFARDSSSYSQGKKRKFAELESDSRTATDSVMKGAPTFDFKQIVKPFLEVKLKEFSVTSHRDGSQTRVRRFYEFREGSWHDCSCGCELKRCKNCKILFTNAFTCRNYIYAFSDPKMEVTTWSYCRSCWSEFPASEQERLGSIHPRKLLELENGRV